MSRDTKLRRLLQVPCFDVLEGGDGDSGGELIVRAIEGLLGVGEGLEVFRGAMFELILPLFTQQQCMPRQYVWDLDWTSASQFEKRIVERQWRGNSPQFQAALSRCQRTSLVIFIVTRCTRRIESGKELLDGGLPQGDY